MDRTMQIQDHVRSMVDADGAVLLDLKKGKYYSLNKVASRVWSKLEEGLTLPEILEHLREKYGLPAQQLEADLEALMTGLEQKELIRVSA